MAQNEFIKKEVTKIIADKTGDHTKKLALAATWIIAHFKGINLKVFDVAKTSSLADYYVIASANNATQARAMTDEISANIKQAGHSILSIEGLNDAEWILVDAGDIIVHIFNETSRDIFDLDTLWAKFPQIEIPESFYFAAHDDQKNTVTAGTQGEYF